MRERHEFGDQPSVAGVATDAPEFMHGKIRRQSALQASELALGQSPERLHHELVHGTEVVVSELLFDADALCNSAGRQRGVAFFLENVLGAVE
jgi:hypothetical protein